MEIARTPDEVKRAFGAQLRAARQAYGRRLGRSSIGQREFAVALGIEGERPEERYRLYEKGEREPPLWILAAIRRVTGISLDPLIANLPPGAPLAGTSIVPPSLRVQLVRMYLQSIRPTFDLAAEMGIEPDALADMESGQRPVPRDLLVEIGTKFNLSYEFLLRGNRDSAAEGMRVWLGGSAHPTGQQPANIAADTGTAQERRSKRLPAGPSAQRQAPH